jgi:hypothetical protein
MASRRAREWASRSLVPEWHRSQVRTISRTFLHRMSMACGTAPSVVRITATRTYRPQQEFGILAAEVRTTAIGREEEEEEVVVAVVAVMQGQTAPLAPVFTGPFFPPGDPGQGTPGAKKPILL